VPLQFRDGLEGQPAELAGLSAHLGVALVTMTNKGASECEIFTTQSAFKRPEVCVRDKMLDDLPATCEERVTNTATMRSVFRFPAFITRLGGRQVLISGDLKFLRKLFAFAGGDGTLVLVAGFVRHHSDSILAEDVTLKTLQDISLDNFDQMLLYEMPR
jgi:hypothetical protein